MALVIYAIALLVLANRALNTRSRKGIVFLLAFIAASVLLAFYENADASILLLGTLIFNGLASTYRSRENYLFLLLALIFIAPFYMLSTLLAQSMLLGFLSGSYLFMRRNDHRNFRIERKRDVVQIILGLVFISAFAFLPAVFANLFLVLTMLLASFLGNYAISNGRGIERIVRSFERRNAALGQGAVWLAIGALLAASFLSSAQAIAVFAAIFVGDAVATLVGTRYRSQLPYNKKKNISGSLAYFASSVIVSFHFVGFAALLTSLVAAAVESAASYVDDNFDTALALTALIKVMGYAKLL